MNRTVNFAKMSVFEELAVDVADQKPTKQVHSEATARLDPDTWPGRRVQFLKKSGDALWCDGFDTIVVVMKKNRLLFEVSGKREDESGPRCVVPMPCRYFACNSEYLVAILKEGGVVFMKYESPDSGFVVLGRGVIMQEVRFVDCAALRNAWVAVTEEGTAYVGHGGDCQPCLACASPLVRIERCWAGDDKMFLLDHNDFLWFRQEGSTEERKDTRVSGFACVGYYGRIVHISCSSQVALVNESGHMFSGDPRSLCFCRDGQKWCDVHGNTIGLLDSKWQERAKAMNWQVRAFANKHQFVVKIQDMQIDVSDRSLAMIGMSRGRMVNDSIVLGLLNNRLAVFDKGTQSVKILSEIGDQNADEQSKLDETISGLRLGIDRSEEACRAFGVLSGESITILGEKVFSVVGVFGAGLWVIDKNETKNRVQKLPVKSILQLHTIISDIQTSTRTFAPVVLPDGGKFFCETWPCKVLAPFGLMPGDVVKCGAVYYTLVGELGYNAILKRLVDNEFIAELPCNLVLCRRLGMSPVIVTMRALDETFVDVNVACMKEDKLWPLDRIATTCGAGTVMGKDPVSGQHWVQMDDATSLNAGVVLLGDAELAVVVRRFGDAENAKVSVIHGEDVWPGDYVKFESESFLNAGRESVDWLLRNVKTGALVRVPRAQSSQLSVIMRDGYASPVTLAKGEVFQHEMSKSLMDFVGLGIKPGDSFEIDPGVTGTVIGRCHDHVMVQVAGQDTPRACPAIGFLDGTWNNIDRLAVDTSNWQ